MRVTSTHNNTATLVLGSASVFRFSVNTVPFADRSEHFCCRLISQIVSTSRIHLNTVRSHLYYRPGKKFILEMSDPIKVVSLFGDRGEPASEWDAVDVMSAISRSVIRH